MINGDLSNGKKGSTETMYKDATLRLDLENLGPDQIGLMKQVLRTGEEHLKYYKATMKAFQYPELRVKTSDTEYYETVIPLIKKKLTEIKQL